MAKVDAIAEKALAQENEVQSFPTLRLYRGPKVRCSSFVGSKSLGLCEIRGAEDGREDGGVGQGSETPSSGPCCQGKQKETLVQRPAGLLHAHLEL